MPLQNYKRSFAPLELKILFAILSCWAYRQWGFGKTAQTFTLQISTQWSKVVAFHNGESPDTVSVKADVVQSTFTVKTLSGAVDAHYISIGK